jgi:large subunit ribosomal protein L24
MAKRNTKLKSGDKVMVLAGGNKKKRPNKGKVGVLLRFVGEDRAIIGGVNLVTRHQRQLGPDKPAMKITREASIHLSNVMYYAEKLERPVRLCTNTLADGRKVRGYKDPQTKEFVQIES